MLPFFKPKKGFQFAGSGLDAGSGGGGGGGGSIDTSALANKTDLTAIILRGTTNTSGSTITSGTWFYLNGKPCIAKVDIASGATFTLNTNYEEKTVGSALTELNSNIGNFSHLSPIGYADRNVNLYFMISLPSNQTISLTSAKVWTGTELTDINLTTHPLVLDYRIGWNCKFYFSNYVMNNRQATMLDLQGSIIRI